MSYPANQLQKRCHRSCAVSSFALARLGMTRATHLNGFSELAKTSDPSAGSSVFAVLGGVGVGLVIVGIVLFLRSKR